MHDRRPVLFGAALIAVTSTALVQTAYADGGQGPYFGLYAAGIETDDAEADGVEIEFDTGFAISGLVGYQFDVFRIEGEFGYQGIEGLSENDVNSDVDIGRFTLNGYFDVPVAPNFGPYVGGGFGVANLSADDDFEDEDSAFTWHAEAGLNIGITNQFSFAPFYRYQWIDTDLGGQDDPLESHLFGVALRYVLTWRGPSGGGYYGPAYRSGYSGGYRSYDRYDRYDHGHYHRPKNRPKSPAERERDRCGWKGPGCDDEGGDSWEG